MLFSALRRRGALAALSATVLAAAFAASAPVHAQDKSRIKVGISVGNAEQIFEVVKKVAARDGLTVDVVVFNDYQLPNAALSAGDLDANAFQHQPFLDNQTKSRGFDLVPVGLTVTAPLGFYSRKLKSIDALPEGASVGIQNDPSNGNRSLLLLQAAGLITLKPEAVKNNTATPLDVVTNPKKLKLVALDAAQLPRSLDDLTIASINNDYAEKSGLSFNKDAVLKESAKSPYANLIAVRRADKDAPWAKKLVAAYQSAEVRQFIETKFNGALIPAF
ncbi:MULTISPECIES: MetQ/NlpA family ABC transporter substrate-binding protein [unclassified Variovorax]|uniref:MetQ/NlpA family ABC transporter substrate-binding protein n=1 Tax=unclassified Variovorax TaxID=663243 RepID=UPI002576241C|nr:MULTISPECIES: MetQ/NlpA family ABC transporter substrate-binding protein [unclassified Variovorax]MDM0088342.1 MetQ/NlpA family ABC transporter substrate-binding protein [Variovorax sp. J22G40]MDM0146415.1 MetQ/NlpA family ABC transporter substrate-binding protein [Variovorax sp. J2P1-31]